MAETNIAAIVTSGGYPTAGVVAASTAADAGNGNKTPHTGKNFLIHGRNSGVTSRVVTIFSVADSQQNRTGNIVDSLTSGQTKVWGPFATDGFKQAAGDLFFTAAHAEILFTVIRF